jgi:hypothetical protein
MFIDNSGNVGFQVTPETWNTGYLALQTGVSGAIIASKTGNEMIVGSNIYVTTGGTVNYIINGYSSMISQYNGTIYFKVAGTGTADNPISYTNAMFIDNSGNVGIKASSFGTNAVAVLGIATGTAPTTSPADMIQIFSVDASAGNATLGLRTEAAVVTESVTSDRTLQVVLNGTVYKLCLKS